MVDEKQPNRMLLVLSFFALAGGSTGVVLATGGPYARSPLSSDEARWVSGISGAGLLAVGLPLLVASFGEPVDGRGHVAVASMLPANEGKPLGGGLALGADLSLGVGLSPHWSVFAEGRHLPGTAGQFVSGVSWQSINVPLIDLVLAPGLGAELSGDGTARGVVHAGVRIELKPWTRLRPSVGIAHQWAVGEIVERRWVGSAGLSFRL